MKIIEKKCICANRDSVFNYFGWPSVARLSDGTLAMTASGFRMRHVCPFGKGIISYSFNEGKTWTPPAVVMDTPLDDRDSGIVPFGKNRAIFTSFNNSIAAQTNWMGKLKEDTPWGAASKAFTKAYLDLIAAKPGSETLLGSTYKLSEDGGYTFGETRLCPVTAPHGPMPTVDGGLLYIGRRFSENDAADRGDKPYIQCWRLNAEGGFDYVSSIENIPDGKGDWYLSCEPHAIQLPDGKILVHIRVQRNCFTTYQSVSTDFGKTFSKPEPLLSLYGGAPAHLLRLSDGRIISVYGYREAPYGIRYMISDDEGEHWKTDLVLDDSAETADLGYPASVELSDGRILTVYYQNVGGASVIFQILWMP